MNKVQRLMLAVGLAGALAFALACGNGEAATTPEGEPQASEPAAAAAPGGESGQGTQPSAPAVLPAPPAAPPVQVAPGVSTAPSVAVSSPPQIEPAPRSVASTLSVPVSPGLSGLPLLQTGSAQAGIWVTGEGSITLEPDLSLVNIGVETTAKTVAQARDEAATAMAAIVTAVKAHGLTDLDVQTQSFNIWPMYEYPEVLEGGVRVRKQIVTGYRVSNSAAIKIRDLDKVGVIIDDVAAAGGDATRINGISFTREDPKPFLTGLREAAVNDALAKAQHFATLTGVQVGSLMYIAEIGRGAPVVRNFGDMEMAARAVSAPQTSISGGELELRLNVQAVFNIQ